MYIKILYTKNNKNKKFKENTMNFQKIQDYFKIRFNSSEDISCFFSGTPFFLLGDITCNCSKHSLMTTLSSGTGLAINTHKKDNIFSIQSSQKNISYSCEKHKLLNYHEDDFSKKLFNMLGEIIPNLKEEISGCDMLFFDNTIDNFFHSHKEVLLSAISLLFFPEQTPAEIISKISPSDFSKKDKLKLLAALSGRENHCIITDNSKMIYKSYRIPLINKKIIFIKTDIKNQYLSSKMTNVCKVFESKSIQNTPLSKDILFSDFSLNKEDIDFLCFMSNEEKRIEKYPNISNFNDFCKIINESGSELIKLCNNSELDLLYSIATKNPYLLAIRPSYNISFVYSIVSDNNVDKFIETFETEYEKKAGYKPTFFICDTVTSGIERGIL